MLVLPLIPKIVVAVGGVVVGAFSGILFNFYYNRGSKYITEPYRDTTMDLLLGVRYIGRGS